MALGNNRDYTATDRSARRRLAVHAERVAELTAAGLTQQQASMQAFGELSSGYLDDRLKAWVDPILAHRRKMRELRKELAVMKRTTTQTIQDRIAEQKQWIRDHGGDLAGYVRQYGSQSDLQYSGNGAEAIYAADLAELQRLEQKAAQRGVIPAAPAAPAAPPAVRTVPHCREGEGAGRRADQRTADRGVRHRARDARSSRPRDVPHGRDARRDGREDPRRRVHAGVRLRYPVADRLRSGGVAAATAILLLIP